MTVLWLLSAIALAGESCSQIPVASRVYLPGSPFKIALSSDGCLVFASLTGQRYGKTSGLAVLRRQRDRLELVRTVKTLKPLTGLVVTPDDRTLIATNGDGAVLFDIARLKSGVGDPVAGSVDSGAGSQTVYANVTADGQTLFLSNEAQHSITVVDLPKRGVLGRIDVGDLPIALTFSRDGRLLYTTSQSARPSWGWPEVCDPELSRGPPRKHPRGAIVVIDVAMARTDPARAVVVRVEAGCNPVRLSLSPSADRAYITARKDNAVLVFDVERLVSDASSAKLATIPAGTAPVPVVALPGGKAIVVGNSNRFGASHTKADLSVIDATNYRVTGSVPSGEFPRDLVLSPDGRTLYLASFGSSFIEMLVVDRLPVESPR